MSQETTRIRFVMRRLLGRYTCTRRRGRFQLSGSGDLAAAAIEQTLASNWAGQRNGLMEKASSKDAAATRGRRHRRASRLSPPSRPPPLFPSPLAVPPQALGVAA